MGYEAVCASDRNPDWVFWYVRKNGLNVMTTGRALSGKFDLKEFCEAEAARLNAEAAAQPLDGIRER